MSKDVSVDGKLPEPKGRSPSPQINSSLVLEGAAILTTKICISPWLSKERWFLYIAFNFISSENPGEGTPRAHQPPDGVTHRPHSPGPP